MPRKGSWAVLSEVEQQRIIGLYEAGMSLWEIQNTYAITGAVLKKHLAGIGITTRTRSEAQRVYLCNEDAFSGPITGEKAYWVGMLMADGCVSDSDRGAPRILLTLQRGDREHLKKFLGFLSADNPIRDFSRVNPETGVIALLSGVAIRSQRLAEALAVFGVVQDKTARCEVRILGRDPNFWRGAVDGDGEVNIQGSAPRLVYTGSWTLTRQFAAFCTLNGVPHPSVVRNNSVFKCQMFGTRALRVMRLLYDCAGVFLTRKKAQSETINAICAKLPDRYLPGRQRSLATTTEIDRLAERL